MEIVSGLSLKKIFLNNGNWWKFFIRHPLTLFRTAILVNVIKMLICKTDLLGFHTLTCPHCHYSIRCPHTCKSRFCSSCGKKATDQWIQKNTEILPQTAWQHITFTLPSELWPLFWLNRQLMNLIPPIAANIIKDYARKKGIIPGIYLAIHTFGRDLKRNFHIHLSSTLGGLSLQHHQWIDGLYFYHLTLKNQWRARVIKFLRELYKQQPLKLPRKIRHIKNYTAFSAWLSRLFNKTWVIHLSKTSSDHKHNIEYLGRYLKRPPIGETRIKHYDGKFVTYSFFDHHCESYKKMTLPVFDFIKRVITHIPDKYFRSIRYYGFLANRVRGKLLPIVYQLLGQHINTDNLLPITWAQLIQKNFNHDPTICPKCSTTMLISSSYFPKKFDLLSKHQSIALGLF